MFKYYKKKENFLTVKYLLYLGKKQASFLYTMKINFTVLVSKVHCRKRNGPERNCSRHAAKSLNNAVLLQCRVFFCKPTLNSIFYSHFLFRVIYGLENCIWICMNWLFQSVKSLNQSSVKLIHKCVWTLLIYKDCVVLHFTNVKTVCSLIKKKVIQKLYKTSSHVYVYWTCGTAVNLKYIKWIVRKSKGR